ncbi:MAG: AI-2E family transporter [Halobacteriales archaeon]|nr:AI-2E family transporter [Halobacteriales archaeon]
MLAAKLVVFGFVLFALVYRGDRLGTALLEPLPGTTRDVLRQLHVRIGETLFVLYFIQVATAAATFVLALAVFLALGIPAPVTLAVLAGVLQFLPVVGPSLVVLGIVLAELLAGDVAGAAVIGVVGIVVIGVLPDAVLRPRLARGAGRLPASLYFVGFTGGLLSLGPVGVIAGPVAVAIVLQLVGMLVSGAGPAVASPDQ